jgi:hypothetical protein
MAAKIKVQTVTTVAELRAILDARAPYCKAIKDAFMRGDLAGCDAAQQAMREAFPSNTSRRASS